MKKLSELFPKDDRGKMIFSASAVGVLLVLAALLPLCFRMEVSDEEPARDDERRMELFCDYWNTTESERIGEKKDSFGTAADAFCDVQMEVLISRCIDDPGLENTEPTGRELTVVRGEDGTELKLCRMWLEATGEWKNWLDVCFDAESGVPYYFYLSRERISGTGRVPDTDIESVAGVLAQSRGWEVHRLTQTEDGTYYAVFRTENGIACYRIALAAYDNLLDIRFSCD